MKSISKPNDDILAITNGIWRRVYDGHTASTVTNYMVGGIADVCRKMDDAERLTVIRGICEKFRLIPAKSTIENPFCYRPVEYDLNNCQ